MKRFITALFTAALLLNVCGAAGAADKYDAMPEIFAISVQETERTIGDGEAYVVTEHLVTTNDQVNAELAKLADDYEAQLAPTLQPDPKKRGKANSTLNVDTVYYRTGEHYVSTMVIARANYYNAQQPVLFTTRTYDLQTGQRMLLGDLFDESSEAWTLMADAVRAQLNAIFPDESRDQAAIDRLCGREALEQADFTLSGMELTLHYLARDIVPDKPTLTHVRLLYPELWPHMTDTGRAMTDNSRWKMVAVTCDDGPKDTPSTLSLNAFRKVGARVTYFIVGKQLERYGYVLQRQYDQNHLIGTHSFHHWGGGSFKKDAGRLKELRLSAEQTYPLIGEEAALFRAPGGTYPSWQKTGMPMPIIQWSLDTYDYTGKAPEKIFYSVRINVQDGDILLCHDTGKYLNKAVPIFGEWLTQNGYMMVTVDELAAYAGVTPQDNAVYWSFREGENQLEYVRP